MQENYITCSNNGTIILSAKIQKSDFILTVPIFKKMSNTHLLLHTLLLQIYIAFYTTKFIKFLF